MSIDKKQKKEDNEYIQLTDDDSDWDNSNQ